MYDQSVIMVYRPVTNKDKNKRVKNQKGETSYQ